MKRMTFLEELHEQRRDDPRCLHDRRVNRSLQLLSALFFLATFVLMLAWKPISAALLGSLAAMISWHVGRSLSESKGQDAVNLPTHEHGKRIEVGCDLRLGDVLLAIWLIAPLILGLSPSFFGLVAPRSGIAGNLHNLSVIAIFLGATAVVLRTLWLCATRGIQTGLVWCTKILTAPFHDLTLSRKRAHARERRARSRQVLRSFTGSLQP